MSKDIAIQGRVHHVGEQMTFASGATKRQLVIDTEEKFNNFLPIDFWKERADKLSELQRGELVTVHINLGGRPDKTDANKFWPDITGWRVVQDNPPQQQQQQQPQGQPQGYAQPQQPQQQQQQQQQRPANQGDDDIPF